MATASPSLRPCITKLNAYQRASFTRPDGPAKGSSTSPSFAFHWSNLKGPVKVNAFLKAESKIYPLRVGKTATKGTRVTQVESQWRGQVICRKSTPSEEKRCFGHAQKITLQARQDCKRCRCTSAASTALSRSWWPCNIQKRSLHCRKANRAKTKKLAPTSPGDVQLTALVRGSIPKTYCSFSAFRQLITQECCTVVATAPHLLTHK